MILGLIPSRLNSTRLKHKPLLKIDGLPIIVHTFKRALLARKLDKVIVCCDDKKILDVVNKYGGQAILTSKNHRNGTERIYEVAKKIRPKLIIDIQGDEPLISPYHIDQVIDFHRKNYYVDIVLPTLNIKLPESPSLIKVVTNSKKEAMYLSRAKIPYEFKNKQKNFKKHLSIISFKPEALIKFSKSKETTLEKIEGIELLRALEIGLKIKTIELKGDSFSVDEYEDYLRAKEKMKSDVFFKKYQK